MIKNMVQVEELASALATVARYNLKMPMLASITIAPTDAVGYDFLIHYWIPGDSRAHYSNVTDGAFLHAELMRIISEHYMEEK